MITHQQYLDAVYVLKVYKLQCENAIQDIYKLTNQVADERLSDQLSTRAINILFQNKEFGLNFQTSKVKELANISKSKVTNSRNAWKKTIEELEILCKDANIEMLP